MDTSTDQTMAKLLSKLDQRRLNIIKYLISSDQEMVAIKELKNHFNCSSQTIISDLKQLILIFPDKLQFEMKYKYIKLVASPPPQVNAFYPYFFSNSIYFILIRTIFSQKIYYISYMCEKLFVSRSTLYRIIDSINQFFTSYYPSLSLTMNPFTIEGPEREVRKFYYDFFEFGYQLTQWPFNEVSHQDINKISLYLRHSMPSLGLYSSHPLFPIILAINLIRYKHKDLVQDSYLPRDLSSLQESLTATKAQFTIFDIEYRLKVSINSEAVRQLLVGLAPHTTYLSIQALQEEIRSSNDHSQAVANFFKELDQLTTSQQLSPLDQDKKDLLLLLLYNCCQDKLDLKENENYSKMQLTALEISNLKEKWELILPGFNARLQPILESFQSYFSKGLMAERTAIMFSYVYSFYPLTINHFYKDYKRLNIAVYTGRSYSTGEICGKLHLFFGSLIEVTPITDTYFMEDLDHSRIDILLTTYPLFNLKGITIHTIKDDLTTEDLGWIYQMINQLKFS
ncbi:helix-turn-helix domain-containing protein [Aerococcus mictus]